MKNELFLLFLILFMISCNTKEVFHKTELKTLSYDEFDQIKLGLKVEQIESQLNSQYKIEKSSNKNDVIEWFIFGNESSPWQRSAIIFDKKTNAVTAKSFIPFNGEKENNLKFILENKFPDITFEKHKLPICKRDYMPNSIFYANVKSGILIRYNELSNDVESLSWTSSDEVRNKIKKLTTCN